MGAQLAREDFKGILIALTLAGLFLICLWGWSSGIAIGYGYDRSYVTTEHFDFEELENNLQSSSELSQDWADAFLSDNVFLAGVVFLNSIWGVSQLIWNAITAPFTILLGGIASTLGIPPIITGAITTIMIVTLIFLVWRLIKTGE